MIKESLAGVFIFAHLTVLYLGKCGDFRENDESRNRAKRDLRAYIK